MVPYNELLARPSIGPALAIKRFFSNPTAFYAGRNVTISELKALTPDIFRELAPLCAEALGCELHYVPEPQTGSRL